MAWHGMAWNGMEWNELDEIGLKRNGRKGMHVIYFVLLFDRSFR
jgi:hypothetical protein